MTPYGDAPRLGDTIDPRLMAQDFSGFARAGAIKGQTLANLGQNIGDIIKIRGEQKKQDAANEKFIKQAYDMFKGTPLEEPVADIYQNYTSEDTTDRERRAIGASIRETIAYGMQAQEMKRQQELLNLKRAEIAGESKIMTLTPQQLDAYTNAGYSAEVVGINADGTIKVDVMKRKGAGGPGGFVPFQNPETGAFGMQPAPPQSYSPTPSFGGAGMPRAIPASGIADAALGYTSGLDSRGARIPTPPAGGFDMEPVLPGETPQPMPQIPVEGGMPQQAPQVPAGQPPAAQPTATQLRLASKAAEGDIPVVEGGKITGFTQAEGSMLGKAAQQADIDIQQALEKQEKEKKAEIRRKSEQLISADNFFETIDDAVDLIDQSNYRAGLLSGSGRALGSIIPGTKAYDLQENYLSSISSQIMLSAMSDMKEKSPTGATGLGSLNQGEADSLRESWGALKIGGDPAILRKNLLRIKRRRFDLIHGTRKERDAALKEGKITQEAYDVVDQMEKQSFPSEFKSSELITPLFDPKQQSVIDKYIDKYNP